VASDNVTLNAGSGGSTIRTLADASNNEWPASVTCYATTVSAGANVLQVVTTSAGLPVQQQGTWTTAQGSAAAVASAWPTKMSDGTNVVSVIQGHNADNQSLGGTAWGINTAGVAQLLNPIGNIDRQRSAGFDTIGCSGVSAGAQYFAVPVSTTIAASVSTGSQTVTPASMTGIVIGSELKIANSNGSNSEIVYVTGTATTTFTATFALSKTGPGITVNGFSYNQARDASVGDNIATTGLSASATYLYNATSGNMEFDRSANGELDGASGRGTAVAAEYEYNGGGPLLNTGLASGLNYDRARNLQGKGVGSATQNAGGAAGATSITVSSAAATNTLQAGQQIRIDRNTGTEECAYVTNNYTPGTAAITLQSALQFTHTAAAVEWDIFAPIGPGLTGFTPAGIGIEEEALFNPADGKYYIERSATNDAAAGANIVLESVALLNGAGTFDRLRTVAAGTGTLLAATGGKATGTVATGAANTVIKNAAGVLCNVLVTTAGSGSGNVSIYDNASTNSGTVIGQIPATVSVNTFYTFNMPAANGITVANVASGPVLTISYA
jgi:hypothetical protein